MTNSDETVEVLRHERDVYWRACGDISRMMSRQGRGAFEQGWNSCLDHIRGLALDALRDAQQRENKSGHGKPSAKK